MAIDLEKCKNCPIEGQFKPASAVGPEDARFLVVVDVPSQAGAKERRLLPAGSLNVFAGEMEAIGFGKEDFRFFPVCLCPYNPDLLQNKTKTAIHKHCRQHFVDEVEAVQPEALIPLGAAAAVHAFGKACIAQDQLVLAKRSDRIILTPIQRIQHTDLVWDGVEWVTHEGVSYMGYRKVITYDGLTATPDHGVYISDKHEPVPFGAAASALPQRRIAVGGNGLVPVRYATANRAHPAPQGGRGNLGKMHGMLVLGMPQDIVGQSVEHSHLENAKLPLPERVDQIQRPEGGNAGGTLRRDWTTLPQPFASRLSEVWRDRCALGLRHARTLYQVLTGAPAPRIVSVDKHRSGWQLWELRAGEPRPASARRHENPSASQPDRRLSWDGDTAVGCPWPDFARQPGVHTHRVPDQRTPVGPGAGQEDNQNPDRRAGTEGGRDHEVGDRKAPHYCSGDECEKDHANPECVSKAKFAHVYDIINAGPRHRFTVSGKVVSNCKITKVRGLANDSEEFHIPIFPLLSPGQVVFYPQNKPIFRADVQSFARFFDSGYDGHLSANVEHGEYTFVDDLQFLIDANPELIAFDTEATGLRWYQQGCDVRTYDGFGSRGATESRHKNNPEFRPRAQILTMQFTVQAGKSYVLAWDHPERPIPEHLKPKLRNQLRQLLCKPERIVVGQNLKFDAVYLWKTEGIRIRIGGDTLMLATLLDENAMERNLDVLTKIHAPEMAGYADFFNATFDKSRMWEHPLDAIRGYGGGDTDACYRVYEKLETEVMADERLWAHYIHVSLPGLNAFAGLETRGMHVDTGGAMADFQAYMEVEVERQRAELIVMIPREIKKKHIEGFEGDAEKALSLGRAALLKDILFHHPAGFKLKPKVFTKTTAKLPPEFQEPSVSSKDHLPFFFDTCPFAVLLAAYVKNERLLGTNVVNFKKKYVVDDMVRPTYGLTTAVTGRSNSSEPNGQNYPKRGPMAKTYGKQFVAPPGWIMLSCDLSQAEMRIAASMANEKTMIEIYRRGGDVHRATAAVVMGIADAQFEALASSIQKDARQKAKAVGFGFIFGMWWRKFIIYAKTQYGVEFTDKEAKAVREGFFRKYKGLEPWHNRVKEFAMEHRYVRSYTGRIRHLPMVNSSEDYIVQEALRQSINSPVQECASSIGVMALGRMDEEIDPQYLPMIGFIHDALLAYVREQHLDWGLKTIKHYMESNPMEEWFGSTIKVPIVADASFGLNFGDMIECPGFRLDEPYNFNGLVDKQGRPLYPVPRQVIPPNNGRLTRSQYTLDTDLELEDMVARAVRVAGTSTRRIMRTRP